MDNTATTVSIKDVKPGNEDLIRQLSITTGDAASSATSRPGNSAENALNKLFTKIKVTRHKVFEFLGDKAGTGGSKLPTNLSERFLKFEERVETLAPLHKLLEKQVRQLGDLADAEKQFSMSLSTGAVREKLASVQKAMSNVADIYRQIPTKKLSESCKIFHHHLDKFIVSVTRDMKWTFEKVDAIRLEGLAAKPGAFAKVVGRAADTNAATALAGKYDKAVSDFIEKLDFTLAQNEKELEIALTTYIKALADYFLDTYKLIRSKRF